MRVGNFSVLIPEGRERDSGHVGLDHGRQYTLRLGNHCYGQRCDAMVTIDGKDMGGFRINAGATIVIERPVNEASRFTFFKSDSVEGQSVGSAGVSVADRGLVQVVFKPERKIERVVRGAGASACGQSFRGAENEEKTSGGILRAMSFGPAGAAADCVPQNTSSGVTGLTGSSNQQFYEVPNLDYDPLQETVISIRLVADSASPRPLKAVEKRNAVPVPVE